MSPNGTTFHFRTDDRTRGAAELLLVPLLARPAPPLQLVTAVDRVCNDAVSGLLEVRPLRDEVGYLMHTAGNTPFRRVLVVSLGDSAKVTAHEIRLAAAAAARWLIGERLRSVTLWTDGLAATGVEAAAAEWALGMALAGFRFAEHKAPDEKVPDKIHVAVRASEAPHLERILPQIRRQILVADAVNYARWLAHQPANVINPTTLAAEARRLASGAKLKCTVFAAEQLRRMGMNGLLAVGRGAGEPACLIQVEYRGAPGTRTLTVLVGKAITFDTGGYSIKPAAGLEALKFDKSGGAVVLGVMRAVAALKLRCHVVGLIAAAENAISDRAYRPGDILRMKSGKTVEIISTDAEGRLVLADALAYAQERLRPTVLIDVATLTGGVGIALGRQAAGLMSNSDDLAAELGEAGRRVHERLWRLPLWDDYRELLKSEEADIKNSSGKREASAILGGMFLKEFVRDGVPWAHLDIAAVATEESGKGLLRKGATGFGVRLLVDYLQQRAT